MYSEDLCVVIGNVAYAIKYAKENKTGSILACLSGRGDKDIDYVYEKYGCGEKFKLDFDV